jgi:GTP cyclohydrolase IA
MASKSKLSVSRIKRPSREEAEAAITTLLHWIGENPDREGLKETPRRVVRAFEEYFEGYAIDPKDVLARSFREDMGGYSDPVLIRNIEVESRCEHHMAPFIGFAHVAYIPNERVIGLSKIARVVDMYARRMQVQERLTSQIATALNQFVKPKGVAVMIEAEHFCMKIRGVRKDHSKTVTTRFLGAYRRDADLRREFLAQIREAPA